MKIGIDLGSSSTLVAFMGAEGIPVIAPDAADPRERSTPSRVLMQGDRALIGHYAVKLGTENSGSALIANFKRHFGTSHQLGEIGGLPLYSEAIAALLLKKVRNDAEIYTSQPVDGCIITAPAHFNDQQRRALLSAADIAGIEVLGLLDEPIAAALHYTGRERIVDDEIIVIYDIGGGTFDLTILTCSKGQMHVLAKSGATDLGGVDFDRIIETRFREDYHNRFGAGPRPGTLNDGRIRAMAETAKIAFGAGGERWPPHDIYLNGRLARWTMDPQEYRAAAHLLLKRTKTLVIKTLRGIGMELDDVNRFILIGGATRGALVQEYWRDSLDRSRQTLIVDQPLESVAMGAAIFADSFSGRDSASNLISSMRLSSVTAFNIGLIDEASGAFERLIDKNAILPVSASTLLRSTASGLSVRVCQYLDDPTLLEPIGRITIQAHHLRARQMVEVVIKNNDGGGLGVKTIDPQTAEVIPFAFEDLTKGDRDLNQQRKAVAKLRINALER